MECRILRNGSASWTIERSSVEAKRLAIEENCLRWLVDGICCCLLFLSRSPAGERDDQGCTRTLSHEDWTATTIKKRGNEDRRKKLCSETGLQEHATKKRWMSVGLFPKKESCTDTPTMGLIFDRKQKLPRARRFVCVCEFAWQ